MTARRYRSALEALTNMARSLESELNRLEDEMRTTVFSYGLSKLPDEILTLILVEVCEPWDTNHIRPESRSEKLRLVSKRFKRVVDTQPAFRGYIHGCMTTVQIEDRLKRSRDVGLKIHINVKSSNFRALVDAVVPYADRWEELHFDCPLSVDFQTKKALSKLKNLNLSRLTKLVVRNCDPYRRPVESIYSTWSTPALVYSSFRDETPYKLENASTILECELVHYGQGSDIPNYITRLSWFLSVASALTRLSISLKDVFFFPGHTETLGSIELPNLQSLEVAVEFVPSESWNSSRTRSRSGNVFYRLIQRLELPKIENVRVTVETEDMWDHTTCHFLRLLLGGLGRARSLQTFEFIQQGLRLDLPDLRIIPLLEHNGTATFGGLTFRGDGISWFMSKRSIPGLLRKLHLKDCTLPPDTLRIILKLFSGENSYPNFENLVLTRCSGFKKRDLKGMEGAFLVAFEDE